MDIVTELERTLSAPPGEPPHRDLDGLLADAHTRLRRRRLRSAGVVAVLALVVGVGAVALVSPGPDASRSIATDPSGGPSSAPGVVPDSGLAPGESAGYVDGRLQIREGVEVLDRVDNPFAYAAPSASVALRLLADGEEVWTYAVWSDSGDALATATTRTDDPDDVQQATFHGWVEVQQLIQGDAGELVQLVEGVDGPTLAARIGATIVEQRAGVELGEEFTPDGWTAYAAVVDDDRGERWYVIVRSTREPPETHFFPVRARKVEADTLDEFLTYARTRLDAGELP